jgi:hypothetical protein
MSSRDDAGSRHDAIDWRRPSPGLSKLFVYDDTINLIRQTSRMTINRRLSCLISFTADGLDSTGLPVARFNIGGVEGERSLSPANLACQKDMKAASVHLVKATTFAASFRVGSAAIMNGHTLSEGQDGLLVDGESTFSNCKYDRFTNQRNAKGRLGVFACCEDAADIFRT